jgi:DNA repair protein RadC
LASIVGVGPTTSLVFALLQELTSFCLQEKVHRQPVLTSGRLVQDYLRHTFGARQDEYVAMLFLDTATRVLKSEVLATGTVNQCAIYPRELVKKALAVGASAMILAHNHPAGSVDPSEADWALTARLFDIGRLLDMPLLDHLVVCREQVRSLRELPRWPRA